MTAQRDLGPCLLCGRPGQQLHHYTGRLTAEGPYLDPDSTVPLCIRCHATEHQCWRDMHLDDIDGPLVARMSRMLWFVGRLADLERPATFDSRTLRGFHTVLLAIGQEIALGRNAEAVQ